MHSFAFVWKTMFANAFEYITHYGAEKKLIVKVSFPNLNCDVKETTVNASLSL